MTRAGDERIRQNEHAAGADEATETRRYACGERVAIKVLRPGTYPITTFRNTQP